MKKNLFRTHVIVIAAIAMLVLSMGPAALAQSSGTSGLAGTVTDPSGAAVPNVTVTLTNNGTGQTRPRPLGVTVHTNLRCCRLATIRCGLSPADSRLPKLLRLR